MLTKLDKQSKIDERTSEESIIEENSIFQELKSILQLSWPLIFVGLFRLFNPLISIIICGKFNKVQFDAASLANSIINVFGVSIDFGFSTACDTLFSQAYGSKNKKDMGFILQRGIIVMTIIYLFLCCFHINIEPILIMLHQDFEITRLTAHYVLLYLPGLFFDFQFLMLSRYLQNQNVVFPIMISALGGILFNAISQYVFIYIFHYGINASAILQGCGCLVMFLMLLIYILFSKVYVETWEGFRVKAAFSDWEIFLKLGIPGIVMISVEFWAYESMSFIAGSLSTVQLGGQTIAMQVECVSVTILVAISIAVSIRVGQNLGSNKPDSILKTIKVGYTFTASVAVINLLIIYFGRVAISQAFTRDEDIVKLGTKLLSLICMFSIFDSICAISGGCLRACGKQTIGAIVMMVAYFIVGIPLGTVFVYVVGMDISGMWIGLLLGFVTETITFLILILRTNWKKECQKAYYHEKEQKFTDIGDPQSNILLEGYAILEEDETNLNENDETDPLLDLEYIPNYPKENNSQLILKRCFQLLGVLLVFLSAIFVKIFLPPSSYIPCINEDFNNSTEMKNLLRNHYPFCNDSKIF